MTLKDLLSKITLGPWKAEWTYGEYDVGTDDQRAAVVPYDDEEGKSNSIAIAAVPDLLDLVIKQQEIILKHCDDDVAEEAMEAYSKLESKLK